MSQTNSIMPQRAAYVAGDPQHRIEHLPKEVTVMVMGEALVITLGAALTRHGRTVEGRITRKV